MNDRRAASRPDMQLYVPKHRRAAMAAETAKEAGIDDSSPRPDVSRSTDKTNESTVHVNKPLDSSSHCSLKASSAPAPTAASNEPPVQNVDMTLHDNVDSAVPADAVRSRPYRVGLPSPSTVSFRRSDLDDSTVTANNSTGSADTTLMSEGADCSICITAEPGGIHDRKLAMNLASTAPLAISDTCGSERIETNLPTGTIAGNGGATHSEESTAGDNTKSSVPQENDVAPTYLPGVNDIAVINSNVDNALAAGDTVRAVEEFLLQSQEKDQSLINNAEDKDNNGGTEQQICKSSAEQPNAVSSSPGKTATTPATASSATSIGEDGSDSWETLYDDLDDSLPEDSVKEVLVYI